MAVEGCRVRGVWGYDSGCSRGHSVIHHSPGFLRRNRSSAFGAALGGGPQIVAAALALAGQLAKTQKAVLPPPPQAEGREDEQEETETREKDDDHSRAKTPEPRCA